MTTLAPTLRKIDLFNSLGTVSTIRGSLYILNNQFNTALTYFQNLQSVGSITIINCPALVDARFPSLVNLSGNITVMGTDRLCPARYPAVGNPSRNYSGCVYPIVNYFVLILGPATASDLPIFATILTNALMKVAPPTAVCF